MSIHIHMSIYTHIHTHMHICTHAVHKYTCTRTCMCVPLTSPQQTHLGRHDCERLVRGQRRGDDFAKANGIVPC